MRTTIQKSICGCITAILFFTATFSFTSSALAANLTAQQAQLQTLQQAVEKLQAKVAQLSTENSPRAVTQCPYLSHTLNVGSTDEMTTGDVSVLQAYLIETGDYTYGEITGYYGSATEAAVRSWQTRNNIVSSGSPETTGFGAVGPVTKDAMEDHCSTLTTNNATLGSLKANTEEYAILSSATTNLTKLSDITSANSFVTHLYQCVMGRAPDTGGLAYWKGTLANNSQTPSSLLRFFLNAREAQDSIQSNDAFVDRLYNCILFRTADTGGKTAWTNSLNSGTYRTSTVGFFLNSPEFKTKVNPSLVTAVKIPEDSTESDTTSDPRQPSTPSDITSPSSPATTSPPSDTGEPVGDITGDVTFKVVTNPEGNTDFATVQAAIDAAASLEPDDVDSVTISIEQNAVFLTETLTVDQTLDVPLTIVGNGPNGKTTFTSGVSIQANELESLGGNKYSFTTSAPVYGIVVGGKLQPPAQVDIIAPRTSDTTYEAAEAITATTYPTYLTGTSEWRYFSCPIDSISGTNITIPTNCSSLDDKYYNPTHRDAFQFKEASAIVNHPAGLTTHGAWIADGNNVEIYLDSKQAVTILQTPLDSYISIGGVATNRVSDVTLKNIGFVNGGSTVDKNYATSQSNFYNTAGTNVPQHGSGAVVVKHANSITLDKLVFRNLTEFGVTIRNGASNVSVTDSQFSFLGGGAVAVGEAAYPRGNITDTSNGVFTDITVADNSIYNIGLLTPNVSAVAATHVQNSTFSDNSINTVPYTGISVGWGWRYTDTPGLENNRIESNLITNPMHTMHDGAGIYTLSKQPGTVIADNTIQFIKIGKLRLPIYLDKGSSEMTVKNNVIKNTNINHLPITAEQPIFGPDFAQPNSPCDFKACEITLSNNVVR